MTDAVVTVHLRPKAHTRLQRGHLWVFSNEIARVEGETSAGAEVRVVDAAGRLLGSGSHNPHSLIAERLQSRCDRPRSTRAQTPLIVSSRAWRRGLGRSGANR